MKYRRAKPTCYVILLLLMSMLGVFPLDVILPSFPALSTAFSVSIADIAGALSLFAIGVAVSQLLIGPLSDRVGRKRVLLSGLAVAAVGAAGCVMTSNYIVFSFFRLVQAAGCGCFVLSQALVQDVYGEHKRNAMRILLTSASGVFISLSPFAGSILQRMLGWTGSFQIFIGLTLVAMLLTTLVLNEEHKRESSPSSLCDCWTFLKDSAFMTYTIISGLAFACHFSFIVVSPLLLLDRLGLTDYLFSLVFLGYGAAYLLGGVIAAALNGKMSEHRQMAVGLSLIGGAGGLALGFHYLNGLSVIGVMVPMMACTAGTTISRAAATTCALGIHAARSGMAAALHNTVLFLVGGVVSGLMTLFASNLPIALGVAFVLAFTGGYLLLLRLVREKARAIRIG